jgi:3-oxoacyl-[acyl-carrier-protein] synthase-1
MADRDRIVVTGSGAVCAAGRAPLEIWDTVREGRSTLGPIRGWDTTDWPRHVAGEIADLKPRDLVPDRKIHKLIRRSDLFGLYAADRAIESCGILAHRESLAPGEVDDFNDRTGVYVGSGGGTFDSQYDYFPLMDASSGELETFGRELEGHVNPMWLLRTLPNNVLCHVGIRHGLKGPNACITNHSVSGMLAIIEAMEGLRAQEAERAVAVGHDSPIEPQMVLYYHQLGLVAEEAIRPFDADRDGSLFGEGAAAMVLETKASAAGRGAPVIGEVLGGGVGSDAAGLLALRPDGDGLANAMAVALEDAGVTPSEVGMIVAHANGTPQSDASEAAAIGRVFGPSPPPVTGFKWAFGHLIAASGIIETVLALVALTQRQVPGIATLRRIDPDFPDLPVSADTTTPRSNLALVVSRGFGGINAALVVRAP